jgi:hypothetical protein
MALLDEDEVMPFFGNPNIRRQGAKARALAAQRNVNTLPNPRAYAATSGLLSTAPDEMGFGVLSPDYEGIQRVARPGVAGAALGFPKGIYGIGVRQDLFPGEDDYFRKNPHVTGMAAEDNRIIMNPYSTLKNAEKQAVMMNEAARVHMRAGNIEPPEFKLTPEQEKAFAGYSANPVDRLSTVAARILSNDPSALTPTAEQKEYVQRLRKFMGIK